MGRLETNYTDINRFKKRSVKTDGKSYVSGLCSVTMVTVTYQLR